MTIFFGSQTDNVSTVVTPWLVDNGVGEGLVASPIILSQVFNLPVNRGLNFSAVTSTTHRVTVQQCGLRDDDINDQYNITI